MKNQCRKDIEKFCRDFLKGRNRHLHDVIDNYRHLLAQINIQQMNLTRNIRQIVHTYMQRIN